MCCRGGASLSEFRTTGAPQPVQRDVSSEPNLLWVALVKVAAVWDDPGLPWEGPRERGTGRVEPRGGCCVAWDRRAGVGRV